MLDLPHVDSVHLFGNRLIFLRKRFRMSRSYQFIRFDNKMLQFDADVELASILSDSYVSMLNDEGRLFPGTELSDRYPVLGSRRVLIENREIAVNHLANGIYCSYIKDLSEEFSLYLKNLVKEAWANSKIDPKRLAGNTNATMTYSEILKYSQQGNLDNEVVDRIFQNLEKLRSDRELLKGIQSRLGFQMDDALVSEALGYLDVRHKLVHTDGFVDCEWKESHKFIKVNRCPNAVGAFQISLDYETTKKARKAITDLIKCIDDNALRLHLIRHNTK